MYVRSSREVIGWERVLFLAITFGISVEAEGTSLYLKPWKDLYQELHQGEKPEWRGLSDVHAWALKERERLEPLVLEVLRGESSDKAWPDMLFVAQVISTEEIRDVLLERVQEVVAKADGHPTEPTSRDAGILALAIDMFAKAKDARIVPTVLELIGVEDQGYAVVEHCVDALRNLGDDWELHSGA